jgi:hypothetical protein
MEAVASPGQDHAGEHGRQRHRPGHAAADGGIAAINSVGKL